MSALFPAPVRSYTTFNDDKTAADTSLTASANGDSTAAPSSAAAPQRVVPKYPMRVKSKFVPRSASDFGDGGAYPEIHLAQFPLGMGKKGKGSSNATLGASTNTLALQVRGDDGSVGYDAVVTQHHRNKTKVYTKFSDVVEKDATADALALPSKDDELETASRTRDALQLLVQGKIAAALPTGVPRQKTATEASTYIRYTPHDQDRMGGGASQQQRIIRMVEVAKDPMEPPKFEHKKAVRGPPSPPVPVLHSPPRKLTVADQQSWKIPPMISNWKNSKGFTIALDKRLAADGRGLQQVTVNDNFASLAEALAIAERKAREEVNTRARVQKKLAVQQKEQKEQALRELASRARMERSGLHRSDDIDDSASRMSEAGGYSDAAHNYRGNDDRRDTNSRSRSRARSSSRAGPRDSSRYSDNDDANDNDDDPRGRRERDAIRRERKKEREREMRLEKLGKKGKLARDDDRDVSEKIALGQLQGSGAGSQLAGDAQFDARLFNQSQGLSAGFGADDDYTVYSKPLADRGKASVYRPKATDAGLGDADTQLHVLQTGHAKRFKADTQFRGTEQVGHGRDGPVQFAYDTVQADDDDDGKDDGGRDDSSRRGRARSPPSQVREQRRGHSQSRSASRSLSRSRRTRSPDRSHARRRSRSPSRSRRTLSPVAARHHRRSRSRSHSRDRKRSRHARDDTSDNDDDDPFGLDQFLTDARKGRTDEPSRSSSGGHGSSSRRR